VIIILPAKVIHSPEMTKSPFADKTTINITTEISEITGHPTAKMGADISENSDYSVVFTKFAVSINGIINRTITHRR
jgi:hypothetical protein